MTIIVTGGAGFIGSNFLFHMLGKPDSLITHVPDRKGHDRRYAVDWTKTHRELS